MKPFDETEIAAELRSMRPAPRPEFAAGLDARAAAGFPRRPRGARSRAAGLLDRVRTAPPRRLLAPAGALATAAVVVATAAIVASESGTPTSSPAPTPSGSARLGAGAGGAVPPAPQEADAGRRAAGVAGESSSAAAAGTAVPQADADSAVPQADVGPYASEAQQRSIERSAEIVLGTDSSEIRPDAARVFDAVHAVDGIVLRSSIRDGDPGAAHAEFELLIPSGRLGDALASISAIAEVRSRNEATRDITAPTIGVGERLQDSRARIEGLLGQLADADSDEERAAVEARLRAERGRAVALKARLSDLRRRASFSRVSVRIETGTASSGSEDGAWGVGDGLDDAGRVLAVAAGVAIVGLAILAPFLLVALLAWLARSVRRFLRPYGRKAAA